MARPVVLCTLPIHESGRAILAEAADLVSLPRADALREHIGRADVILVRSPLPADAFEGEHQLLGAVRNGTGLDFIPVGSATRQGIAVANVPGANTQAVVEYCVGAFLLLARRFDAMNASLRATGWDAARALSPRTSELAGKTVGIVGVGSIGARLARVCKDAFGMRVLGHQPNRHKIPPFVEAVDLGELLEASDFVSLHCPLVPETRNLLDEGNLARMKRGAFLVNAARGEVVDETALARLLAQNHIAGAVIDVYSRQPLPRDHPLLAADNAILTPHVAALTEESSARVATIAARQILCILAGERPEHLVNPEAWEAFRRRFEQRRFVESAR